MTSDEWQALITGVHATAQEQTGVATTLEFSAGGMIACNPDGVIGGQFGGGLHGAKALTKGASVAPHGRVMTVAPLDARATHADATFEVRPGVHHQLQSLEDVAIWLVLHELGHLDKGHSEDGTPQEAEANAFAAERFENIRAALPATLSSVKRARRDVVMSPLPRPMSAFQAHGEALKLPVGGFTCGDNAHVCCDLLAVPGTDVAAVIGVAWPPGAEMAREGESRARIHVWVRVGATYFDVTWTRWEWDLARARYTALGEIAYPRRTNASLLDVAKSLVAAHGIEVVP